MTRPFRHLTPRLIPLAFVSALALTAPMTFLPNIASAQADVSITFAPPPLPIYVQPPLPAPDYIWAPGYWAWGPDGYYWVPGTWVEPPEAGLLWTPGYWAWNNNVYVWNTGYWGPEVGFYGGINYGYGYTGNGYYGGRWDHGHFFYNRAVNHFGNVHITNVYNAPVHNTHVTRVSFNGGHGGISARPNATQQAAFNAHRVDPTSAQAGHQQAAAGNHAFLASVNHGRPTVAATSRPASFSGAGISHASNRATFHPAAATTAGGAAQPNAVHSNAVQHAATPGTAPHQPGGNPHNNAAPAGTPHAHTPQAHTNASAGTAHPQAAHPQHAATPHPAPRPQHAAAPHPAPQQHAAPQHAAPQGQPHGDGGHDDHPGGNDHPDDHH